MNRTLSTEHSRDRESFSDPQPFVKRASESSRNGALPHSEQAEMGVLGSMLVSPREAIPVVVEKEITPAYFYIPAHQTIYKVLIGLWNAGQGIDLITFTQVLRDRNLLDTVGGAAFVTHLFTFVPTAANVGYYLDTVRDKAARRTAIREAERTIAQAADESAEFSHEQRDNRAELEAVLTLRRFDAANPPPPAVPRFRLGEAVISTPANLTGIQAQAKGGKTAFLGACMAATMEPTGDCLGITASNPKGHAVVHLDTEQSPADHHAVVAGAMRRAGLPSPPDWLRSYRLADVPLATRRKIIAFELERAEKECGGIYCVLLDGVADFLIDPNDSAEAFTFIDGLHQLAIRYDTSVIAIIHENPSSELGKTRGHLGSQLERKAETNLRLSKDGDGITTVFAERARHAHIPKEQGSRFVWSDEERMHVSTDATPKGRPKAFDGEEIIALMGGESLTYTEALTRCEEEGWKTGTFKAEWKRLKGIGRLKPSQLEQGKWGAS